MSIRRDFPADFSFFSPGFPTFAPWDSNLKTKKNASGKRPPDEAHGPGDETIRPQRSSEAERSSEKKVHNARCSDSASRGCTELYSVYSLLCQI